MLSMRFSSGLVALLLACRAQALRETSSRDHVACASTSVVVDGAGNPLRECEPEINVLAGDIVTYQYGGPDFRKQAQDWKDKSNAWVGFFTAPLRPIMELYTEKKQTTENTSNIAWTHAALGVDTDTLMSAYYPVGVVADKEPCMLRGYPGSFVVSRYVGDQKDKYRKLASERAKMWQPYLNHYAGTIGEWWPAVASCVDTASPGENDYFEAVNDMKVREMWGYDDDVACDGEATGWLDNLTTWVKDRFRTHDESGTRCKPKAMFCSKFAAAVWSSVIGNPTDEPQATPKTDDLKKMWPFRPGACAPWDVLRWLLSQEASKFWDSCLVKNYRGFGCNSTRK